MLRAGAQRKWEPFQELLEVYVGNSLWERRGLRGRAGRWQMGVPRAIAACSSPSGDHQLSQAKAPQWGGQRARRAASHRGDRRSLGGGGRACPGHPHVSVPIVSTFTNASRLQGEEVATAQEPVLPLLILPSRARQPCGGTLVTNMGSSPLRPPRPPATVIPRDSLGAFFTVMCFSWHVTHWVRS